MNGQTVHSVGEERKEMKARNVQWKGETAAEGEKILPHTSLINSETQNSLTRHAET
jgi:hypothetical protein